MSRCNVSVSVHLDNETTVAATTLETRSGAPFAQITFGGASGDHSAAILTYSAFALRKLGLAALSIASELERKQDVLANGDVEDEPSL
jgi:hypothetical protein